MGCDAERNLPGGMADGTGANGMKPKHSYQPPYTITSAILNLVAGIREAIGRFTVLADMATSLRLRRVNRIRTIRGSLAIEGNTLNEEQITAIMDGRRVIAPPREIQEVRNAITAYDRFAQWNPLFANIPVESMVHEHQAAYYTANWYKLRFLETYLIALYDMIDS